jgi:hypothetical protein
MAASAQATNFTLIIDEDERIELVNALERALRDSQVEARRTESPEFHDKVRREKTALRGLIAKLGHP